MKTLRLIQIWLSVAFLVSAAASVALAEAPGEGLSVSAPKPTVSGAKVESSEDLLRQGNELFEQADAAWKTDRPRAESLFKQAAAVWRELARRDRIHNSQLETNIGNASTLGGDWPHAILAYRRAQELDPRNENARAGLAAARKAAGTEALATGVATEKNSTREGGFAAARTQIVQLVGDGSAWMTRVVSPRGFLLIAVIGYTAFFGLLAARACSIRSIRAWHIALAGGVCLLAGVVIVSQTSRASDAAVVVSANAVARNGPSEVYEPTFQEKLRPGLEVRIEETRGTWTKVRLTDGRSAWVRTEWLEQV